VARAPLAARELPGRRCPSHVALALAGGMLAGLSRGLPGPAPSPATSRGEVQRGSGSRREVTRRAAARHHAREVERQGGHAAPAHGLPRGGAAWGARQGTLGHSAAGVPCTGDVPSGPLGRLSRRDASGAATGHDEASPENPAHRAFHSDVTAARLSSGACDTLVRQTTRASHRGSHVFPLSLPSHEKSRITCVALPLFIVPMIGFVELFTH